jgi:hypothetical protein
MPTAVFEPAIPAKIHALDRAATEIGRCVYRCRIYLPFLVDEWNSVSTVE